MKAHRYVVLADRVRGFDLLEAARGFALANYPAVLCERRDRAGGGTELVEIERHDLLYDDARGEWRIMLA
jgi:hypothetical protein